MPAETTRYTIPLEFHAKEKWLRRLRLDSRSIWLLTTQWDGFVRRYLDRGETVSGDHLAEFEALTELLMAWCQERLKVEPLCFWNTFCQVLQAGESAPAWAGGEEWNDHCAQVAADVAEPRRLSRKLRMDSFVLHPLHGEGSPPLPLNEKDEQAAEFIRKNPGAKGCTIASAINCDEGHFRSRIVPKLKAHHFVNANPGYYPPEPDV